MRLLRHVPFTVLVTLGLCACASAQVTLVLDSDAYSSGSRIAVTATPAEGERVARPRFATIADGAAIPRSNASVWMDFPAFGGRQTFTVRAPEREGAWWLLLADGDRLVGRVPFDVVHWSVLMERTRARLESELGVASSSAPSGASAPGPGGAPSSASAQGSVKGLMRRVSAGTLSVGERFDVVITLPATPGPGEVTLSWGDTFKLSWEDKAKVLESNDPDFYGALTLPSAAAAQTASAIAPFKPGTFELRLFRGAVLLDVLPVTTK